MNLTECSKCCPSLPSILERTKYQRSHKSVWRYPNCRGFYREGVLCIFCLKPRAWHFHGDFGLTTGAALANPAPSPRSSSAQSFNFCPLKLSSEFSTEGGLAVHKHSVFNHLRGDFRERVFRRKWPTTYSGLQESLILLYHSCRNSRNGALCSPLPRKRCRGAKGPKAGHTMSFFLPVPMEKTSPKCVVSG